MADASPLGPPNAAFDNGTVGSNLLIDAEPATGTAPPDSTVTALLYENPDYVAHKTKWQKYLDCYEANDMVRYVFKHSRESNDIFERRVARMYYYNYVASVIDLFVAYLFHAPITRQAGNLPQEELDEFFKNSNRAGDTYHIFIQNATALAQACGWVGILVDTPQTPGEGFSNEEERKAANHRPYLSLYTPLQVLDWKVDEFGKFEWVKLETNKTQDRSWKEAVDENIRTFLIWTRTTWEEWQVDDAMEKNAQAKLLASGPNPLGEVPFVILRNERCAQHQWFGLSAVRDIADINIGILNWSSLGDEEIYERCLNVLALEKGDADATITLSHNNTLEYAPGAEPPFYLEPGATPLEMIAKWIRDAKQEIFTLAKLGGSSGIQGQSREATSGIAYAFEFNETNQSLAKKAESLEQAERELLRLFAKWFSLDKEWDGEVTYAREFGVEDFLRDLELITGARTTLTSETAIKELETKVVLKMFSRSPQALRDKMVKEIENNKGLNIRGLLETFGNVPPALTGPQKQTKGEEGSASGGDAENKDE